MKIMLFADDIFEWGDNREELQGQINEWVTVASEYGLKFSAEKSEVVVLKCEEQVEGAVVMKGTTLKQVDHFKYLGSICCRDGGYEEEG
jgi:Reverse transcriptase (RNA-dependent DNA polymerase).